MINYKLFELNQMCYFYISLIIYYINMLMFKFHIMLMEKLFNFGENWFTCTYYGIDLILLK